MSQAEIRFEDGAAYERLMGLWSRPVGDDFLSWLQVPPGRRWLDVGCGNGAFTAAIVDRCAPAAVTAIDPSEGQLAYARKRLSAGQAGLVQWLQGDAQALPVADATFDVAVMALVLFFVPDPARGLAEMLRALRRGGLVAAYHWDILNGGFPYAAIGRELQADGVAPMLPPSAGVSTPRATDTLWRGAGLQEVELRRFDVSRHFASFAEYWDAAATSNTLRPAFSRYDAAQLAALRTRVAARLGCGEGPVTVSAWATAVLGRKPAAA